MGKDSFNGSKTQIEWICLQIFAQLLRRHLRYLLVVIPMYLRSIYGPARCHVLRASYCFARYLDDVLDGDITIAEPQQEYVTHLIQNIKALTPDNIDQLIILGKYVFKNIDRYAANGTRPSLELDKLIEAMLFDRERANRRFLLSRKDLDNHQLKTFLSALNVTLSVTGAHYYKEDIIPLARAQGSLYTLRDLDKDLQGFINNIPKDVLYRTRHSPIEYWNYDKISKSKVFQEWVKDEYNRSLVQITKVRRILDSKNDHNFKVTVGPLYKGLNYLTRKLRKQYEYL
jgi:hypothetical protein